MGTTNTTEHPSGILSDFFAFLADLQSMWSWIAKIAVVGPIADVFVNLGPPWPSRFGVAVLMALAELIVLAFVFEFFKHGVQHFVLMRLCLFVGALMLLAFFVLYIALFSFFTLETGEGSERVVIGWSYHPDIEQLQSSNPSSYTPKILLRKFHDVDAIWTPTSIRVMQWVILVTWILLWLFLASVLGIFVIAQWHHAREAKGDKGKREHHH